MSGFNKDNLNSPLCSQQGSLIPTWPGSYDYYLHVIKY